MLNAAERLELQMKVEIRLSNSDVISMILEPEGTLDEKVLEKLVAKSRGSYLEVIEEDKRYQLKVGGPKNTGNGGQKHVERSQKHSNGQVHGNRGNPEHSLGLCAQGGNHPESDG